MNFWNRLRRIANGVLLVIALLAAVAYVLRERSGEPAPQGVSAPDRAAVAPAPDPAAGSATRNSSGL